jgi:hypothetical protein
MLWFREYDEELIGSKVAIKKFRRRENGIRKC